MVICAALVFLISPEHMDARFAMGLTALLTLVALKWVTDGELVDSLYLLAFLN